MGHSTYVDERLTLPEHFIPGKIGVVTVLYNSALVLPDFFASIEQQTYTNFVVYYVNNSSVDDSSELCRARDDGRYVVIDVGKNVGVAAGNNIGIRSAVADGCEYILLINNDVRFNPSLFAKLVDGLSNYSCDMTTPLVYYNDQSTTIWAAGGYFQSLRANRAPHYGHDEEDRGQFSTPRRIGYTPTCCVLIKRELFQSVGMMDERYFAYYDDTDFMLRAWRRHYKLFYLPEAKLWHKVSSLTGTSSPFTLRLTERNRALYIHKNMSPLVAHFWSCMYRCLFAIQWLLKPGDREKITAKAGYWQEGVEVARGARG